MKIDRSYYDENKHLDLLPGHEWALVGNMDEDELKTRIVVPTHEEEIFAIGKCTEYPYKGMYYRMAKWDFKKPFDPHFDGLQTLSPMTQIEAVNFVYELAKTKMVWIQDIKNKHILYPYWTWVFANPEEYLWSTDLETWNQFVK